MYNLKLYQQVTEACSRITTEKYSTSFNSAINLLQKDIRQPIHNIYGFVRFADEIVDTFHNFEKLILLNEFKHETYISIKRKISLNPIINSFQSTVNEFNIDLDLIDAFFHSMELDLNMKKYDNASYEKYIYGSAEVVGLMCLSVFCNGDKFLFEKLKPGARSLGAAFQKVNFLRDTKMDFEFLNRSYFPEFDFMNFTNISKQKIENDIQKDFDHAYGYILNLPNNAKFGVFVAYKYYFTLFKKIQKLHSSQILKKRVRISNYSKAFIVFKSRIQHLFNFY